VTEQVTLASWPAQPTGSAHGRLWSSEASF
jgi:hypothetical protein